MGSHFLLQGIFLTQDLFLEPKCPAWQVDSSPLSHLGTPNIMLTVFFFSPIYQVKEVSFCFSFVEWFYHKRVLGFVSCFFCVCWCAVRVVFMFHPINMVHYIDFVKGVKPTLLSWPASPLVMVYNPFCPFLRYVYVYNYVFLMDWSFYHCETSFFISRFLSSNLFCLITVETYLRDYVGLIPDQRRVAFSQYCSTVSHANVLASRCG